MTLPFQNCAQAQSPWVASPSSSVIAPPNNPLQPWVGPWSGSLTISYSLLPGKTAPPNTSWLLSVNGGLGGYSPSDSIPTFTSTYGSPTASSSLIAPSQWAVGDNVNSKQLVPSNGPASFTEAYSAAFTGSMQGESPFNLVFSVTPDTRVLKILDNAGQQEATNSNGTTYGDTIYSVKNPISGNNLMNWQVFHSILAGGWIGLQTYSWTPWESQDNYLTGYCEMPYSGVINQDEGWAIASGVANPPIQYPITYTATDADGAQCSEQFVLTVHELDDNKVGPLSTVPMHDTEYDGAHGVTGYIPNATYLNGDNPPTNSMEMSDANPTEICANITGAQAEEFLGITGPQMLALTQSDPVPPYGQLPANYVIYACMTCSWQRNTYTANAWNAQGSAGKATVINDENISWATGWSNPALIGNPPPPDS